MLLVFLLKFIVCLSSTMQAYTLLNSPRTSNYKMDKNINKPIFEFRNLGIHCWKCLKIRFDCLSSPFSSVGSIEHALQFYLLNYLLHTVLCSSDAVLLWYYSMFKSYCCAVFHCSVFIAESDWPRLEAFFQKPPTQCLYCCSQWSNYVNYVRTGTSAL